jgi:hypothetical protein
MSRALSHEREKVIAYNNLIMKQKSSIRLGDIVMLWDNRA